MTNIDVNDEDAPRMHKKDEKWQPPRSTGPMEGFLRALKANIFHETRKGKNLKGSELLEKNKQHSVLVGDKNIGAFMVNRTDCISTMVRQHF